jgi:hypothetical protein
MLSESGVKEVTLLGQNVNSYADVAGGSSGGEPTREGEGEGEGATPASFYAEVRIPLEELGTLERPSLPARKPARPAERHTLRMPASATVAIPSCLTPSTGCVPQGFSTVYRPRRAGAVRFAELLDACSAVDPELRVRFTSPHPKDFTDDVLEVRGDPNHLS